MSRALKRARVDSSAPKKRTWVAIMKPGMSQPGRSMPLQRYSSRVPELKFVDVLLHNTTSATAPTGESLFQTVQGAFGYQRIGQRVQLKSLRIRGNIEGITAYTGVGNLRILIVYDRQPNGALPVWSDVVQSVTAAGGTQSVGLDGLNMANRERFKVLVDEQLYAPGFQSAAGVISTPSIFGSTDKNPSMFNIDRYVNLRNLETHFNNTNGGTIADIQTGSLVLFFAGDNTAAAKWTMEWLCRVRYQDI